MLQPLLMDIVIIDHGMQCNAAQSERVVTSLEVSAGGPGPSAFDEAFDDVKEAEVMRKLDRHILASFCVLTVLNYLDRTNLAFAALQLNKDLGFSGESHWDDAQQHMVGQTRACNLQVMQQSTFVCAWVTVNVIPCELTSVLKHFHKGVLGFKDPCSGP